MNPVIVFLSMAVLCSAGSIPVAFPEVATEKKCTVCKVVVSLVDDMIKSNTTESAIIAQIQKFCSLMPSAYAPICKDLVEQYIPLIISYITQEFPPEQICTLIGFCGSLLVKDVYTCNLCKWLVMYIADKLEKKIDIQKIIQIAEAEICSHLGKKYTDVCDSLVETYIPQIVAYIESGLDPQAICKAIGLCV